MQNLLCFLLLWLGAANAIAQVQITPCPNRNNPGVPNDPPCFSGFPLALTQLGNDSILYSSPTVADLDGNGSPEIIVGTYNGYVVAVRANGTTLWAYKTGIVSVQSKPAVADIDADGTPEVVVSVGDAVQLGGGMYVISHTGQLECAFTALNPEHNQGMYSSPALARMDPTQPTHMQIVSGSFDFRIRAFRPDCSVYWTKALAEYVVDTSWSSPAVHDLDNDGQIDVIMGQDSNLQTINGFTVPDGGMLRAFRGNGAGELPGFPILIDEVIYSSPAIGDLLGNGQMGIAVGNGRCWDLATCIPTPHVVTKAIYAWNANGSNLTPSWPRVTPGESARTASPALADLDNDGDLEIVLNTLSNDEVTGNVHVLRADSTELAGWPKQPDIPASCTVGDHRHDGTVASPVVVDINGNGVLDIILPAANEFVIWDRFGTQLTTKNGCPAEAGKFSLYSGSAGFFSSAAVADLNGDGKLELIGAGSSTVTGQSGLFATLYVWTFPTSINSPDRTPWPMFRHDVRNTGVLLSDRIFRNGFE